MWRNFFGLWGDLTLFNLTWQALPTAGGGLTPPGQPGVSPAMQNAMTDALLSAQAHRLTTPGLPERKSIFDTW